MVKGKKWFPQDVLLHKQKIKVSKKKNLTSKCYGNTKVSKFPKKIEDNFTGSIWNNLLITEAKKKVHEDIKAFFKYKSQKIRRVWFKAQNRIQEEFWK